MSACGLARDKYRILKFPLFLGIIFRWLPQGRDTTGQTLCAMLCLGLNFSCQVLGIKK